MDAAASAPDFLLLEDGKRKKAKPERHFLVPKKSAVVYIGRVPHGFYEEQMRAYFSQFGTVKRLRLSRSKKTGKSKHYAFVEFESPEVAEVVSEAMDNYLMFGSIVQVKLMPLDRIHPQLWRGANRKFQPRPWNKLARELHHREKDPEKQRKLAQKFMRNQKQCKKKLNAAGIDYDFPQVKPVLPSAPKKIVFEE